MLSPDAVCKSVTSPVSSTSSRSAVGTDRRSQDPKRFCQSLKLCKLCCAAVLESAGLMETAKLEHQRQFNERATSYNKVSAIRLDIDRAGHFLCKQVQSLGRSQDTPPTTYLSVLRSSNLTQGLLFEVNHLMPMTIFTCRVFVIVVLDTNKV